MRARGGREHKGGNSSCAELQYAAWAVVSLAG